MPDLMINQQKLKEESRGASADILLNLRRYFPVAEWPMEGIYGRWGLQSITDFLIGRHYFTVMTYIVPFTLLPIIKLCADNREEVYAAYKELKKFDEKAALFDSPRERWRIMYGNIVREIEWACFELRKYFTKRAYEELIIDVANDYIIHSLGSAISFLSRMMSLFKDIGDKIPVIVRRIIEKTTCIIFERIMNVSGFLAGAVKITEFNLTQGIMTMEVLDCLMLRAPRMETWPEEACLLVCKGGCEKAFSGQRAKMLFEPRLPEPTCEIRLIVDHQQ